MPAPCPVDELMISKIPPLPYLQVLCCPCPAGPAILIQKQYDLHPGAGPPCLQLYLESTQALNHSASSAAFPET